MGLSYLDFFFPSISQIMDSGTNIFWRSIEGIPRDCRIIGKDISLYEGFWTDPVDSKRNPVSFLRCGDIEEARKLFSWLRSCNHRSVVRCFEIICYEDKEWLVVVERVETLKSYFGRIMEVWISTSWTGILATDKAGWFSQIEYPLANVFRDVISACSTVICEEKFVKQRPDYFNHLEKCLMFSGAHNCVKLLPFWDAKNSKGIDIDKLQQLMSSIIGLPFELTDAAADVDFKLPNELVSFLHNLSHDNLKYVGLKFLLDAPYFWSGKEGYRFIDNLYDLMKRNVIKRMLLNEHLKCRYDKAGWKKNIAQNAVLSGIYKYAGSSGVAPAKYELDIDVVRFSSNAYRHYNDEQYKNLRTKALERVEIEDELRAAIPNLYVNLFEALLSYAKSNASRREAIFEKALSSELL